MAVADQRFAFLWPQIDLQASESLSARLLWECHAWLRCLRWHFRRSLDRTWRKPPHDATGNESDPGRPDGFPEHISKTAATANSNESTAANNMACKPCFALRQHLELANSEKKRTDGTDPRFLCVATNRNTLN